MKATRSMWTALLGLVQLATCLHLPDGQSVLQPETKEPARKLQGRFLQITDFHPDPFYKRYSSTTKDGACHRGSGPAGYYGAETSECDSPITLVNATFDWIAGNVRDKIDFVIWTGDSARHDNDGKYPRNDAQVISLNELLVTKFVEVFGRKERDPRNPLDEFVVPIVPTLGNNDILPHNIFEIAPNSWTKTYLEVWRKFIPEEEKHEFDQGGWFSVDVIPNYLTVFSLNTLYFFSKNAAVDGCAAKSEPGYKQMEWLRIQLQFLRDRGMKAILIGHVPPALTESKQAWDETCWQKYALWMQQYRDVVVGTLYGHMNTDHFMLQDFRAIEDDVKDGFERQTTDSVRTALDEPFFGIASAQSYIMELRSVFSGLPKKPELSNLKKKNKKKKRRKYWDKIGGRYGERYSMSFVSPSVIPNYFPTMRIYEYNITGLEHAHPGSISSLPFVTLSSSPDSYSTEQKTTKKKHKKYKFKVPEPPSKHTPPGPAYSPQALTFMSYTQYFANLTRIHDDFNSSGRVPADADALGWNEGKHGKHNGQAPHEDKKRPGEFGFEILYDTSNDSVYNLPDLTVASYLDLAQRIGQPAGKSVMPAEEDSQEHSQDDSEEDSQEDGQEEEADGDSQDSEDELDSLKKGKKKKHKKKKGKKGKHQKCNTVWHTFVRRAFVETLDADGLEDEFGP